MGGDCNKSQTVEVKKGKLNHCREVKRKIQWKIGLLGILVIASYKEVTTSKLVLVPNGVQQLAWALVLRIRWSWVQSAS